MAAPSGFPSFRDGDVKLVITDELTYTLHRTILAHGSPLLKRLLAGASPLHMLVLVDNTERVASNGVKIKCVFERVPLDSSGRPVGDTPIGIGSYLSDDDEVVPLFTAFDSVLRALYSLPLEIGNAQTDNLTSMLSSALDITLVAEYLDCAHIVTQAIESKLLATGQNFYRAIKLNPVHWLEFGNRIKSKAIFKEALIHAAGQFSFASMQEKLEDDMLPDDVYAILHQKAEIIKSGVKKAESCLTTYYPQRIMRKRPLVTESQESISRASYSNDIYIWQALTLFRHFLGDQMAHDRTHHAPDQGYSFIKTIDNGGEAYLSSIEVDRGFLCRFPMSSKASLCLKQRLAEIKQTVKQWTTNLLQENSQLDLANTRINYFTNTVVTEEDYPWLNPEQYASDDDMADDGDTYDSIEGDEIEEDDTENGGKTAHAKDNVGRSLPALHDSPRDEYGSLDEYDTFPFEQLDGNPDYDGQPLDDLEGIDGVPMPDLDQDEEEDDDDSDEDEEEIATRQAEEKADYKAAKSLLRLNPNRPLSPASHGSGDTEVMDPKVYQDYLFEQQMKRDLVKDNERVADNRRRREIYRL